MIYVLKFGAAFVLPPGIFLLLLAGLAVRLWRRGERGSAAAISAVVLALYVVSMPIVSSALMRNLESAYVPPRDPSGDVIVLLGGGATKGTPDLDGEGGLSGGAANRLLTAARLYRRLHIPILAAGGQVYADSASEAETARRMLLGLGVPDGDIILEAASRTTGENARNTAELLRAHGFSRPLLITSAFHMKRAMLNFEKQGVAMTPFPTDYWENKEPRTFNFIRLSPDAGALGETVCVMREELRFLVTRLTGF